MANLPESATYDAGVYQLELTDPVQGGSTGVSNAPLKNLANRTAWLKSQIDGINNGTIGLALYARLASPTFTGSPAAPTAALGDNTIQSIAIDPEAVDPEDVEMLEDMVLAAVNEALRGVSDMAAARMSAATGGMNIPGLM